METMDSFDIMLARAMQKENVVAAACAPLSDTYRQISTAAQNGTPHNLLLSSFREIVECRTLILDEVVEMELDLPVNPHDSEVEELFPL